MKHINSNKFMKLIETKEKISNQEAFEEWCRNNR